MQELGRIYWTRQGLRLAYTAVMVWLAISLMTALMPKGSPVAGTAPSTAVEVLRGLADSVIVAVTFPGLAVVVMFIVAAVINAQDVRRRDPVRRFTRQQRREGMARAGGQCELEAGLGRRCARPAEHGDHFYPWSKGGSTSLQNFCCGLRQVQSRQTCQDPVAKPAATDGTTTAGLRFAVVLRQRGRTSAAALTGTLPTRLRVIL